MLLTATPICSNPAETKGDAYVAHQLQFILESSPTIQLKHSDEKRLQAKSLHTYYKAEERGKSYDNMDTFIALALNSMALYCQQLQVLQKALNLPLSASWWF